MTFNEKDIEVITSVAKEVEGLEVLLDFEWDGFFDRKAIAERYGLSVPKFEGSTDAAFKEGVAAPCIRLQGRRSSCKGGDWG